MEVIIRTGGNTKQCQKYFTYGELITAIDNLNSELSEMNTLMDKLNHDWDEKK